MLDQLQHPGVAVVDEAEANHIEAQLDRFMGDKTPSCLPFSFALMD
jgi:hypothetical protein